MNPANLDHGGYAEVQAQSEAVELRIAPQPLDLALREFSRQSGMQVIVFSSLTIGLQSPGISGRHTVSDALRQLLAGTGLTFRLINARTVEIREVDHR
jgi:hypothetical protein